ncbi:cobalt-precorrin-6A reductase [Actinoplanes sp. TFC3]|uniref:cobalt-precorrin-6A reductase n=1 Tax=Actinoplanes sp. TFC3 TaxID=1710355 RepID=UPI0009E97B89|nr:cobalt-precorrin-6A reductase [Actinoplanes sp. TFC3]
MPPLRILLLGGTTEARALADRVAGEGPAARAGLAREALDGGAFADGDSGRGVEVVSSLAGRTSAPLLPRGEVRIGGFGGVDGLKRYLHEQRIDALVDATHPFAATMTSHAVAAAEATGLPLLILRRPGWTAQTGDVWHRVESVPAAAALVPSIGERVFLTTGRQSIAAFAELDTCWFLSRSVEAPAPPVPPRLEILLDRGPFTIDGERDLLRRHRVDVLVTKNSGGDTAKLDAARAEAVPVILVDRPPLPKSVPTAPTVEEAIIWLNSLT